MTATAPNRTGVRRRRYAVAPPSQRRPPPRAIPSRRPSIRHETSNRSAPTGSERSMLQDVRSGPRRITSPVGASSRQVALARETETNRAGAAGAPAGSGEPLPWLSPAPVTNAMLGLPATVRACLFDVEESSRTAPPACLGVGRSIRRLPFSLGRDDGMALDPLRPNCGLPRVRRGALEAGGSPRVPRQPRNPCVGRRPGRSGRPRYCPCPRHTKGRSCPRRLREQGVTALPGARRYLEAARRAGVMRAVVYESASTSPILDRAGVASLVDVRIDAAVIGAEGLRSRPAPDLLLAACRRLAVPPAHTVTFTTTAPGWLQGALRESRPSASATQLGASSSKDSGPTASRPLWLRCSTGD